MAFSQYPRRSEMEGCPCCVSETDKEKIHIKELRQLDGEDLARFAYKAMTTWGNTEDFKHYLPRIFELLSTTDFIVDTFVVLGMLRYGKWKTWPIEEQVVIKVFLLAWWNDMTKNKGSFDQEAFIEIYKLLGDVNLLLDRWVISFNDNSFKNLIDLIGCHYQNLVNRSNIFKKVDNGFIETLLFWLRSKQEIIYDGFFHYEKIDKEFAEKVSNTLYLMEQIK